MSTPLGKDLGRSQGTDFYSTDDLLTDDERGIRDRVRTFVDDRLIPASLLATGSGPSSPTSWSRPTPGSAVAGGSMSGYGCPGMSALAEGLVTLELARGDGSFSTFNSVHSGLAMTAIGLLGYDEQKQRWLPDLVACTKLGAFALTEPDHGSDVVRLATTARRDGDALGPRRRQALDRPGHPRRRRRRLGPRRRRQGRRPSSSTIATTTRTSPPPATTPRSSPANPATAASGRPTSASTASASRWGTGSPVRVPSPTPTGC